MDGTTVSVWSRRRFHVTVFGSNVSFLFPGLCQDGCRLWWRLCVEQMMVTLLLVASGFPPAACSQHLGSVQQDLAAPIPSRVDHRGRCSKTSQTCHIMGWWYLVPSTQTLLKKCAICPFYLGKNLNFLNQDQMFSVSLGSCHGNQFLHMIEEKDNHWE